jgi:hypothetical protein
MAMNNAQLVVGPASSGADCAKGAHTADPLCQPSKEKQITPIIIDGEPWLIASEVCSGLEIKKIDSAMRALDDDEKGTHTVSTLGGPQKVSIVSESGFYHLAFISRKPAAQAFRRWVTKVVLPAIHRTGFFATPSFAAEVSEVRMGVRDYAALRGIVGHRAKQGLGQRCAYLCRKNGLAHQYIWWKDTLYPVWVLDKACLKTKDSKALECERGPLLGSGNQGKFVFPNSVTA